ncbi:E3 ubiquitin-protein ligase RNF180 isoform X2 [Esox lucius]|uniref:E3 ubiquitin-protein ligase RNF180 isoform X2 n=1 Tax=Esox lucius TaxID=8010 RepID=UPI0014768E75|nr:E3 ubiquitin-protein ligase RNF180 isoform X2 [Esox lucius]
MDNPGEGAMLRCRRCRKSCLDTTCLHPLEPDDGAASAGMCRVWHMNVETLPEWILTSVRQAQWTVGKLNCENCGARLGSFNFLKCTKCPCGQESIMHLSKSRVDQDCSRSIHVATAPKMGGRRGQCCLKGAPGGAGQVSGPDKPEAGDDYLVGSPLCCTPVSRFNTASLPVTTRLDPFYQTRDISANQSVPLSTSRIPSHRRSVARGTLEPSCSSESRTGPVDGNERGTEHMAHAPVGSYTLPLIGATGRLPTCTSRLTREGSALLSSEQQTYVESSGESVQLGDLPPGSTPFAVRGPGVSLITEEEVDEEGRGRTPSEPGQAQAVVPQCFSKREKNRLKSQRRKRRKKELWLNSQSLTGMRTESEEEDREAYTCAVCLDVYFSPYSCQPCGHIFCEPCLRTLAKNRPTNTPCPLCRTLISQTLFQKELNQTAKAFFPVIYHSRKHNFQNSKCAKWPLPSCRKQFPVFWGYQRQAALGRRWYFPQAGFTMDALDLADMRAWLFDIDLVHIYIQSVNWIPTLLVLCFLLYYFS